MVKNVKVEGNIIKPVNNQGECHQRLLREIKELERTKALLAEGKEKYALLAENLVDFIVKADTKGHFLFVNPSYCHIMGKNKRDLLRKGYLYFIHNRNSKALSSSLDGLNKPPNTSFLEQRILTSKGWRWIAWSIRSKFDNKGNLAAFVATGRDITEHKLDEERLRQNEIQLQNLNHSIAEGVILWDAKLRFVRTNPEIERLFREDSSHLEGYPFSISQWKARPEWEIIRPDGTPRPDNERPANRAMIEGQEIRDVEGALNGRMARLIRFWLTRHPY
jgi:PAS domain S-box-containing protein